MSPAKEISKIGDDLDVRRSSETSSLFVTSSQVHSSTKSTSSRFSTSGSSNISYENKNNQLYPYEGRVPTTEWTGDTHDSLLPIATRGLFYNDSFFEDTRSDFDLAVRRILDQSGDRSDDVDDLSTYRKLREDDLQENNQAVSVSEDDINHKVVLDVRDFMRGDLKVKMIDENELVVEGRGEKDDRGRISKEFKRRFTFPGLVKSNAVSSVMSSDGVLTVTVPKRRRGGSPLRIQNSPPRSFGDYTDTSSTESRRKYSRDVNERSLLESKTAFDDAERDDLLPINRKGLFYKDSYFESSRKNFDKSVQGVLHNFGRSNSVEAEDNMATYRNIREKNIKLKNQAVSITEEDDHHKVVLDVKDFMDDVAVKMVDENQLTVEGKMKRGNVGSSSKTFFRSFTFPGLIKPNSVHSAISSDGILTITIPKDEKTSSRVKTNNAPIDSHTVKTKSFPTDSYTARKRDSPVYSHTVKPKTSSVDSKIVKKEGSTIEPKTIKARTFTEPKNKPKKDDLPKIVVSNDKSSKAVSSTNVTNKSESSQVVSPSSELQIVKKGSFFQDKVFSSHRQDFKKAVQDVLSKYEEVDSDSDDMSSYKALRERDLKEGDRAVSTAQDDKCHKVVIDVSDFKHTNLKVKIIDENELVVEGMEETNDGEMISKWALNRRFTFPGLVNSRSVKSTLSSDGILAIVVPKKPRSQKKPDGQENFFAKAQNNLRSAAKKVFHRQDKSTPPAGRAHHYRHRREGSSDDDHSLPTTENELSYQVEVDVSDFIGGDFEVKAIEQNKLLVKGSLEVEEQGKSSVKSFNRRVRLPGPIDKNGITHVLTKGGLLIITATKSSKKSNALRSALAAKNLKGNETSRSQVRFEEERK